MQEDPGGRRPRAKGGNAKCPTDANSICVSGGELPSSKRGRGEREEQEEEGEERGGVGRRSQVVPLLLAPPSIPFPLNLKETGVPYHLPTSQSLASFFFSIFFWASSLHQGKD
eukprot:GHVT01094671.1.p1 GENE.GHVT01094671.1~~GHVT01094671.1.p1  ORF type:complete len:113 (-),score=16.54 GHVT01094671.1:39-377(-)